jgi:hypothetical protein
LKKLGHNSRVLVPTPHPFGFKEDIIIFPNKIPSHFRTQNNKNSYFVKRCRYISRTYVVWSVR